MIEPYEKWDGDMLVEYIIATPAEEWEQKVHTPSTDVMSQQWPTSFVEVPAFFYDAEYLWLEDTYSGLSFKRVVVRDMAYFILDKVIYDKFFNVANDTYRRLLKEYASQDMLIRWGEFIGYSKRTSRSYFIIQVQLKT